MDLTPFSYLARRMGGRDRLPALLPFVGQTERMMRTLALGARGYEVEYLRRLLGDAGFISSSGCSADLFDESVERAVRAFQQARRGLAADGVVAPSTWLALGVRVWREHAIRLVPQVDDETGWSAAASMVSGSSASIGPGQALLGPHDSGLRPGEQNRGQSRLLTPANLNLPDL